MTGSIVLFEDQFVEQLNPINLARPTCRITCGAYSLEELVSELGLPIHFHVRPHLRGVMERDGFSLARELEGPVLFINAALVPDLATIARLFELAKGSDPFLALNDQRVTAAWCPSPPAWPLIDRSPAELVSFILDQRLPVAADEFATLEYPFHVVGQHMKLLKSHLERRVDRCGYRKLEDNVFVGADTTIGKHAVIDGSDGLVLIGNRVKVRPLAYISGPVQIGDACLILDHAAIKHGTVLRHTVKAGGEIEDAVIEAYSNKQHHGFLGHAWVGSWVNLGAGTSNSDLKNTYGEITQEYQGRRIPTKMMFLGCVIGDYTKTAINTSIFTGKLVGVASYLYGFVSTNVPSFTNYARSFGQVTEVSVDIAVKTQSRVASRRQVQMSPEDALLMQDLFELTRSERQLSSEQVDF